MPQLTPETHPGPRISRSSPVPESPENSGRWSKWTGPLRWFTSLISNGVLEGINSLIQAAKAKARS
jgi:transposase